MNLFVDSAAHIALLYRDDQHHKAALGALRTLEESRLITSSFVLNEVASRGASVVGAAAAARYVRGFWERASVHVVEVGRDLFLEGLAVQEKYEDQGLSLTDAVSVVLMRSARIRTIFTFDRAFRRLGFQVIP